MSLTEEQKVRIEQNKLRAQHLLKEKQAREAEETLRRCVFFGDCGSHGIDQGIYDSFDERVCSVCKLNNPSYDLITRADAISGYLVPEDALKMLKYQSRDNPHNPGWTAMKLYLKKHVIDLSIKRFGSLEEMEKVKKEREVQRFEKSLDRTHEALGSSAKEMWSVLNDSTRVFNNNEKSVQDEQQGRKRTAAAKEDARQKKKKSALSGLVGIIRGPSDGQA